MTLRGPSNPGEEENWIGIQDLIVEKVQKEMIFLGETVLQIWQRQDLVHAHTSQRQHQQAKQAKQVGMDVDS